MVKFDFYLFRRSIRHWFQRRIRGWDDSDTWALDGIIAKFAVPRLKLFKDLKNCHPNDLTKEEWDLILDDIIYALETSIIELDHPIQFNERDWDRVCRGLESFGNRFRDLWW